MSAPALFISLLLHALGPEAEVQLGPLSYNVSPRPLDFGSPPCEVETTSKIAISNTGGPALAVRSISYFGESEIAAYNDGSGVWPAKPGERHLITVGIHPAWAGRRYKGTVTFRVEYHDQEIAAERARLQRLIDPVIDFDRRKLAQLRQAGPPVDIIDTLKLKAEMDHQKRTNELQAKIDQAAAKIRNLGAEEDNVLREYRMGFFCGGCGRTRSDLLAHGEPFPHPGQKIVPATPEQIAAKEQEYAQKIAAARQELANLQPGFAQIDNDLKLRILDLDQRLKTLQDQWQLELENQQRVVAEDQSHRDRVMKRLDELSAYFEEVKVAVSGQCPK